MLTVHDLKIEKKDVILTSPLSQGVKTTSESDDYKAPNFIQLLLSFFKNIRPGYDLTYFQLPPLFNMPKSQLQCTGELVYCVNKDLLSKCATGETAIDRMIAFVAWNLSTIRLLEFGIAPYNPILGETHLASRGTLNVLLEQVSHHPPVIAMHGTDETNGIEIIWCQHAVPKFYGTVIEGVINGKRRVHLTRKRETYVTHSPILQYRLLPKPGISWAGKVIIKCKETNLETELFFKSSSILGFGGSTRNIKGKIIDSISKEKLFEIHGQWDRIVYINETVSGNTKVLYNAKEATSTLSTPILKDFEGLWKSESAAVWAELNKAIMNKEWEKAREAKRAVEEKERQLAKQRKSLGQIWKPKYFNLTHTSDFGWDISPKLKTVPQAPIIFPV